MTEYMKVFFKQIKYPNTWALIMTIECYFCLDYLKDEYSTSLRTIIIFICYASSIIVVENKQIVKDFLGSLYKKIALVISWLYGTFAFSGVMFIDSEEIDLIWSILFYFLNCIWVLPIMLSLFLLILKLSQKVNTFNLEPQSILSLKDKIIMLFLIISIGIIVLIAFNPAITSPDSEECYAHAFNIIIGKPITDDHPAFYKFLISIPMRINKSISFIIFCQILFYAIVVVKGLIILNRCGISRKLCFAILVVFGISYNTMILLVTLWKDIPYTISLLWLTILVGEYILAEGSVERKWFFEFVIASIFVSFIRHGGIIPVIIVLGLFFVLFKDWKRIGSCLACFVVLALLIKMPLYSALNVEPSNSKGLKYWGLTGDIQYVYKMGGELDDDTMKLLDLANNFEDEGDYNPFYVSNEWSNLDSISSYDFLNIYMKTFLKHPLAVSKSILIRSNYVWSIVKPSLGVESCVSRLTESHRYEERYEISIPHRKENLLTILLTKVFDSIEKNPIVHTVYWRTGAYLFLLLAIFVFIISYGNKQAIMYGIPFVAILLNDLVLVISSGSPSYRYYWPNMVQCSFLLSYGIIAIGNLNKMKECNSLK